MSFKQLSLLFTAKLHVSGALCIRHQEYIKTVDAITGTSHVSVRCRLNPFRAVQGGESPDLGQLITELTYTAPIHGLYL